MQVYNIVILLPAHLGTQVISKICHRTLFILSLFPDMETKLLMSLLLSVRWTADKAVIYRNQLFLM